MPPNEPDRRRCSRRAPQPDETLARMRLRTGRELTVVNISASGALVEGLTRLLPGTRAEVHVVTRHGRVLVRTRVVRSLVWRLEADSVWYRTALAFEAAVDIDAAPSERDESTGLALSDRRESNGYPLPSPIAGNDGGPGIGYRAQSQKSGCDVKNIGCSVFRASRSRGIDFGIRRAAVCRVGGGGVR